MPDRRVAVAVVMALLCAALAACAQDPSAGDLRRIKVWTLENLSDRFTRQQEMMRDFTARTGIQVDLQGIDEGQLPQLVVQSAAAGTLPDAIGGLPLALVRQLDAQEVLDADAAGRVVDRLGEPTFAPSALELTRNGDRQLAVPSDAWAQVLVYRKDLFEQAGLSAPTSYDTLRRAAAELTGDGRFGITLATDPADVFTSQTLEALALGNGCQLVDAEGQVRLDSPECATTFGLYTELARQYSPKGIQTVDTTRESYFAGQSAMVLWSTFLLDELAGLRDDALPTCPECAADPEFLSRNSGVVTSVTGPQGGEAGTFGEITSWIAVAGAKTGPAEQLIEYMMSDAYPDWLGLAPEGKFPVRNGDPDDPQRFTDEWARLPAGVDRRRPLVEVYDATTLEQISGVAGTIERWAITQDQGELLGAVASQLPLSQAVAESAAGGADLGPTAQDAVEQVQEDLS
ncbi:bicyclomycin resistance protein [Kineosporia sp. NBRC 101677]|uniref:ABC transporter substrate-binding protein n=1 Tax=Kineosporia sp. NBRC 101677 TaxID=3032197 RepID=UPI0024A14E6A|nr:extracellular solute-binding protein [Kineosporia sp. NBRC 101677]GLY14587.1 bicyclomycin resistance protein [Kineosporia sp. NBRC 101677]